MIPWALDVAVGWTGAALALLWLAAAVVGEVRRRG